MFKQLICLALFISCVFATSELQTTQNEQNDRCLCLTWNSNGVCIFCSFGKRDVIQEETSLMLSKGCFCIGPWLGGLCLQWSGGNACTSGKRDLLEASSEASNLLLASSPLMAHKGCYCISQWLGGICLQWSGSAACSSGKRELLNAGNNEKCLCLTWNSNGICILCSFGRK